MADPDVSSVSLFEIGNDDDDWPVYNYRQDWDSAGATMKQILQEAEERQASPARSVDDHHAHPRRPERYLDIAETRPGGVCLYIFRLNAVYGGQQRLLFVDDAAPFLELPLNSSTGEAFIEFPDLVANSLGAAFTCDLDRVRDSELAKRIRQTRHDNTLNIPFYFNVVDPLLDAAPWVLSDHSHAGTTRRPGWTHGGVHPKPVAFLSVSL